MPLRKCVTSFLSNGGNLSLALFLTLLIYLNLRYGCDLACTPMIISDSFIQSVKARDSDFTTNLCKLMFASQAVVTLSKLTVDLSCQA
jgi:hypothetical protein